MPELSPRTSLGEHDEFELPRKRVRKGTKSCWECKRRKIRCQLSTEDVPVCSGCRSRGTQCLSQEYPEQHDTSGGPNIGERLGRVELLLEKLVSKITQFEEEEKAAQIATPESIGSNDVLTPFTANATITNIASIPEEGPTLSFYDDQMSGCCNSSRAQSHINTPSTQSSGHRTPSCRPNKTDRLRQVLVDLLPCQQDVNIIFRESSCWLLMHALNQHSASVLDPGNDCFHLSSTFNVTNISKQSPSLIAKTLLYVATCMQQLPSGFDASQLQLGSTVRMHMDKIMSTVQTLVTSDDEIVSTTEGLECIILQGVYHINIGNPRRAWLSFRRALNVAQLMGLHKLSIESDPGRRLWNQIVQADRYLALLLGLPIGSADPEFGPTETFQNPTVDKDLLFTRKLCIIASQIVERNQAENIQAYAATQTIDEMLESLAKEMPKSWWTETQFTNQIKTLDAAKSFDRLMIQIWYFQLETLLHLPFMLRSAKERKYDYSRFACLKAAREMTHRYLALRLPFGRISFCCKVIDFGALTAVVTLFIGLLDSSVADEGRETNEQKESDRVLIQTLLRSMEELADGGKDVVATQSVNVIKTLLAVECPGSSTRNLRLTIPYFGTMNIIRSMPNPCNTDVAGLQRPPTIPEQSQTWQGLPFFVDKPATAPVVSFTSSQFAPLPPEQQVQNWDFPEADTLYFDSLLNSDIESNWIF